MHVGKEQLPLLPGQTRGLGNVANVWATAGSGLDAVWDTTGCRCRCPVLPSHSAAIKATAAARNVTSHATLGEVVLLLQHPVHRSKCR
ncbi:GL14085 [Drosophila persimilis]|uniref:GL14085 n=1 Tax=Drosophila persimilis TaxID=7234 RepID=B4IS67_DROPE|nr:GL14085 [Drosophila persimilis]